jgi:hypothetical protein
VRREGSQRNKRRKKISTTLKKKTEKKGEVSDECKWKRDNDNDMDNVDTKKKEIMKNLSLTFSHSSSLHAQLISQTALLLSPHLSPPCPLLFLPCVLKDITVS